MLKTSFQTSTSSRISKTISTHLSCIWCCNSHFQDSTSAILKVVCKKCLISNGKMCLNMILPTAGLASLYFQEVIIQTQTTFTSIPLSQKQHKPKTNSTKSISFKIKFINTHPNKNTYSNLNNPKVTKISKIPYDISENAEQFAHHSYISLNNINIATPTYQFLFSKSTISKIQLQTLSLFGLSYLTLSTDINTYEIV